QVKPLDLAAAITRLEGAEEAPVAGQSVNGALQNAIPLMNVLRRECRFKEDSLLDVLHSGTSLKFLDNRVPVGGQELVPVVMRSEVRRVYEHIQGFSTGGRHSRVSPCWSRHVAGRIGCGFAFLIDGVEFLLGVARKDEVVMKQVLVGF